jgi:maltose alpha-D-glucosyltransferase/alpha-amylase
MTRLIRTRREIPEISWGDWKIIRTPEPGVLIMRYEYDRHVVITLHNFGHKPRAPRLEPSVAGHERLVDLIGTEDSRADENGRHTIQLPPYGYRWFRPGQMDGTVTADAEA